MRIGFLTTNMTIPLRTLLAVIILISSILSWFFFIDFHYENIFGSLSSNESLIYIGKSLFLASAVFSAFVGSLISEETDRKKFMYSWITLGVFTAGSLAIFQGFVFALIVSVLLGISLGLGFPACLAFLAESTTIEERGRVSGIVILATLLVVIPLVAIPPVFGFGLTTAILLVLLRLISYSALLIDPVKKEQGKRISWRKILSNKVFIFYVFPWLMVNIADGLTLLILGNFQQFPDYNEVRNIGYLIRYISVGFFGLMSGFVSDRIGRKKPIFIGLVLMGVSFALLGYGGTLGFLSFLIISGVGWGFLFVMYFSVLRDIAFKYSKERFYALGWIIPISIQMGFGPLS
jgi:MFS family permease